MHSNAGMLLNTVSEAKSTPADQLAAINYDQAEQQFINLLEMEDLDKKLDAQPTIASNFEKALTAALTEAYEQESGSDAAHRFLQRVLYRINRLKLFWYDDLRRYTNERSAYLRDVRDRIETPWQEWELAQIDVAALQKVDVKQALIDSMA